MHRQIRSFRTPYMQNFLMTNLFSDVNLANLNSVANYNSSFGKFSLSLGNYYMSNVSKLDQNFSGITIISDFSLIIMLRKICCRHRLSE